MDARLRSLLRKFANEQTEENAMLLATALIRVNAPAAIRATPLSLSEIMQFPRTDHGHTRVEGIVRLDFNSLWVDDLHTSRISFEDFLDRISELLVGDIPLMNVSYDIVDVDPGDVLIIKVDGEVEVDDEIDDEDDESEVEDDDEL